MLYRKIKGSKIFTGYHFAAADDVLIVQENGIVEAIIKEREAGEGIEKFDGIVCPGFVNAHCHIELSHLKNVIPQHTGLVGFVEQVIFKRDAGQDNKHQAMQDAEMELYNSGTVAVGDICNTADSIGLKQRSKLHWHNFIEVSGFVAAGAAARFENATKVLQKFENDLPQCTNTLVPHAPYSVSKILFELINNETASKIISIHNQEAAAENEWYKNKTGNFLALYKNLGIDISSFKASGKSSLQSWLPYFKGNQKIISVHNTFINEQDIAWLASFIINIDSFIFCICPNANLYIENTLPPVELLVNSNNKIVLGTDSIASNKQLNISEEIKTIQKYFSGIGLEKILQWATLNGAAALGIDDIFGSFEKGKKPGIVIINDEGAKLLL